MKKRASSTLISLKMEDELLAKLDAYCDQTGMSRTAAIHRSISETLNRFSVSHAVDTVEYLKTSGQWYEWTDYEGNWCLPGCSGVLPDRQKAGREQNRSLQQLYAYYEKHWVEAGDFQKIATCRGVNGLAVIWGFSRIYIDRSGVMHEDLYPYLQKTVAQLKRKCRDGQILTDVGDDGTSDFRIIWFVPESSIKELPYESILNATEVLEKVLQS